MAKPLKDEDRRLWRDAMRGVKPLQHGHHDATEAPSVPPAASPRLRDADDRASARATRSIDRHTLARIKRGEISVEARLDLHGLTQDAAHRALLRFIAAAATDGVRLALVITGKGRSGEGVLRAAVPRWLNEPATRAHILAVTAAPPQLGGGGALCIRLRRVRERPARP
jgi:DNA-nicking Smr family endonuclease